MNKAIKEGRISKAIGRVIVRRLQRKGIAVDPELLESREIFQKWKLTLKKNSIRGRTSPQKRVNRVGGDILKCACLLV
jgi:hypothetical protein